MVLFPCYSRVVSLLCLSRVVPILLPCAPVLVSLETGFGAKIEWKQYTKPPGIAGAHLGWDWIELDWIELDWIELDWIQLG